MLNLLSYSADFQRSTEPFILQYLGFFGFANMKRWKKVFLMKIWSVFTVRYMTETI